MILDKENTVFDNIKNYILENPNAFQIASTFVIGVSCVRNLALHVQEVTAKV